MTDYSDKVKEHLLPILASVALCAGGVYYWSYRVERNRAEAIQQFEECVKEHLRDPRHYLQPPVALLIQLSEVARGETCKSKLPDKSKRLQILHDPHFFAPGQLNQLQRTWKIPETSLRILSPADLDDLAKRLHTNPSPWKKPGSVLFSDDMLSEKAFGPMSGPHCRASYDSEGYVVQNIHASEWCDLQLLPAGQFGEHVKIDMWVKLRSGANNRGYGLLFAQQPADSTQLFAFRVDTFGSFQLSQYTDSWQHVIPWTPDSNIRRGYNVWNRLTVEIRGQSIELFVNGQRVGSAVGTTVVKGFVGCHLDSPGMVAVFRNITVSQL